MPKDEFDMILSVNLVGIYFAAQAYAKSGGARVLRDLYVDGGESLGV